MKDKSVRLEGSEDINYDLFEVYQEDMSSYDGGIVFLIK
jgi:hypothetical protein